MVDIFNELYTKIANALRADFNNPAFNVSSLSVAAPASFPAAQIVERSNTTYERTLDSANIEHHARIMIQCDYFDNSPTRQSVCRKVAAAVDNVMQSYNFTRTMLEPTDNADTKIYRMTARYAAIVSTESRIYRA